MTAPQTSLSHHPLLPFALARTTSLEAHRPTAVALPFAREERPPSLWRDSLAVDADGVTGIETWVFLALAGMVLPALAINQSVLWHLLNHGVLNRVIHAFLLTASL